MPVERTYTNEKPDNVTIDILKWQCDQSDQAGRAAETFLYRFIAIGFSAALVSTTLVYSKQQYALGFFLPIIFLIIMFSACHATINMFATYAFSDEAGRRLAEYLCECGRRDLGILLIRKRKAGLVARYTIAGFMMQLVMGITIFGISISLVLVAAFQGVVKPVWCNWALTAFLLLVYAVSTLCTVCAYKQALGSYDEAVKILRSSNRGSLTPEGVWKAIQKNKPVLLRIGKTRCQRGP